MALPPPLDPRPLSEPVNHPPGAPREVDIAGCTICLTSGEERIRLEWDQKLGQDSWNPPEHFQGGLKDTEPTAGCPKLPMPSFPEDPAGGKYCETPASGWEVLEAEQDSLHLCLLGLGLRLQHLERGPGPWTSAQSRMVHLQALQADLRGAAEHIDALLAFGEGLAQRSEPQAWMSLQQVLRALRAHRESILRRLRRLQAQLVFEETNSLDQDLEVEGDSDWPGPGGLCSPWAPSSLATLAELEWDPAGDVGGLGPLGQKTAWTPGDSCELCGHRGPQSRGQGLEVRAGMGRFHPGTHRTPLHTSQQGPSLSRRFGGSFSFCLSVCLSVSFSLGVVTVFSSLLPLSLLVSVSSSISLFLSLLSIYIYISSFPLTLPLAHPTTTTLASWLFFRHSKFTPISKAQLASSLHSILTSNVTSSQRPAVASKHHHSLSFYFIS
ncbi:nesprin-4 isoform X1 [Pteropus vampyrus]|uniref:Nesprin-4 isoform X1 n=1 Tax=Pteropus vampyrus TaxID=132908 RepID=A0A6P3REJ8_PTEVA|nr:nesprin-4 isoform X1 [Pteropus vampyrus]XP_011380132.1 nesprin-4 isoform X1 [Pteropus vampyrus]